MLNRFREGLTFANVMSMTAVFIALGGSAVAATIAKNSVGTRQIKSNGVGASEIKRNAVGASEIKTNGVRAAEIRANSVGSSEAQDNSLGSNDVAGLNGGDITDGTLAAPDLGDNSVDSSKVPDNSLNASDIDGNSLDPEVGPDAFARVDLNAGRTLEPDDAGFAPQNKGIAQADVVAGEGGAATGTTCFDLPFRPASALVDLDNADALAADRNLVASVAIDRGEDLGDCPATHNDARVRIVDGSTEAAQNARFFIWFEK